MKYEFSLLCEIANKLDAFITKSVFTSQQFLDLKQCCIIHNNQWKIDIQFLYFDKASQNLKKELRIGDTKILWKWANYCIGNLEKFQQYLFPEYLRHKNLDSFLRKLNIYEFKKTNNNSVLEFKHKYFR
ncbi:unnamed protein product [Paramecium primaurelia]|uniref:HSF-type DNA-binding domain-containing protein n=1 Tax=Paramecium primaurelia TaxID=5886 RepID=A0A8S1QAJ2_PARPR|nr:unnamed protein product [Paramecium primaurelia]